MQNPESYVAQGKDNTGAAIQLKPFDTSTIFKAYDYQPKKPLLDSLGKDIATPSGAVHPNDRKYVTELKNKLIKYTSEIQAKAAKYKRDITGEERQIADAMKMEVIDMTSLLQKQFSGFIDAEKKVEADPFSFEGWEDSKNQFFTNHPLQRGFSPRVKKLPDVDVNKIFGDFGTAERSGGGTTNRADGSSSGGTFTKFDPIIAKQNFNDLVVPFLNSGTPDANRVIASLEKDVRKLAELQKLDYTKLSDVDKMSLVLDVAQDQYMAAQEAKVHTRRTSSTSEADATKVEKAKADKGKKEDFGVVAGWAYSKVDQAGINVPVGIGGASSTELIPVARINISGRLQNERFAQLNKEVELFDKGVPVVGKLNQIVRYGNKNGTWEDGMWAIVSDKEKKVHQIWIDGQNMDIIKKEYELDPNKLFDSHSEWRELPEKVVVQDPRTLRSWSKYDENEKKARLGAWERKFGKGATKSTAPKKTTAPTSDPDEEFKRN